MSTKFYLSISLRFGDDRSNVKATYTVDGVSYNLSGDCMEHLTHCCEIKGLSKPVSTDYPFIVYLKDVGPINIRGLICAFDKGQAIDIATELKSILAKIENLADRIDPKIDTATLVI